MRNWLIVAMLASSAAVLAIMWLLHGQLRRFREAVPALRTPADVDRFKRLAAGQMYASLFGLIFTWVPLVVWLAGKFWLGQLGWLDALLFAVLPMGVLVWASGQMVGTARAVRATPATDPAILAERDRVVNAWLHRNLPNW